MPSYVPLVPFPNRGAKIRPISASATQPVFHGPVLWVLRVLAWLAFGVASYLAWNAINQTTVAGCSVSSAVNCDLVLTSSWSKWVGVPVAVLGLACYAALATLSVLLGVQRVGANRWLT